MINIFISYIKKITRLKNIPADFKKENTYQYGQIYNTYLSLFLVLIILFFYLISYLFMSNFFLSSIIASIFILGFISFTLFVNKPIKRKLIAANLTIFILFISTYPITLLTGGINSSTVIWLTMYPAIIVFMTGIKNASIWFVLSIISISSLYFFKELKIEKMLIGSNPKVERFLDLIMMSVALFIIIYAINYTNKKVLKKLETTQSELLILATTDPLTGLFNRRFFEEKADSELKRSRRYKKTLTLLMLDLDYFKTINDKYGHKAGDYVLEEISNIFQKNLRDIDLIGRYGGEEFIMLFPESDQKTAHTAAERIRKDIENKNLSFCGKILKVTISIGISEISNNETESLDTLTHRADEALYQSKKNGRNMISIWNRNT